MTAKTKVGMIVAVLLACILLVILVSRRELRELRTQQLASIATEANRLPAEKLDTCVEGSTYGCMQTLLVSEYGKIETFSSKVDGHTGLKLTSNNGKEYVFTDSNS